MKLTMMLGVLLTCLSLFAEVLTGKVVAVTDGDTIKVLDGQNVQHKIRLDKIDAPEKKQAYGEKSKQYLSSLIFGKEVKVEWKKKDKYGRILGEVYSCSTNVNLQMVREGMAWHYKFFDKTPSYARAELEAREKKVGLWNDPNPIELLSLGNQNVEV